MKRQKLILSGVLTKNAKKMVSTLLVLSLLSALYVPSSIAPTPSNTSEARQLDDTVNSSYEFKLTAGVASLTCDTLPSLMDTEESTPLSGICRDITDSIDDVSINAKETFRVSAGNGEETPDEEEPEPESEPVEYDCNKQGFTTDNLNVRSEPNTESDVLEVKFWNTELYYDIYDENWAVIPYDDTYAYVSRAYLNDESIKWTYMDVYGDRRKSYMDYTTITSTTSLQKKIQDNFAYTSYNGVRAANGRFLIALGSYYSHIKGQYVDLILENGTVIPAIIGDCKKNKDTNSNNSVGADGSVAEFIVETSKLSAETKLHGDVSYSTAGWNSNVIGIRIYDKNLLY